MTSQLSSERRTPARTKPQGGGPAGAIANVVLDLVAPLALFYGLQKAGFSQVQALLVAAIVPVVHILFTVIRTRRIDGLALLLLVVMAASVGLSLYSGDAKFLLAKDGGITGIAGLWLLLSLLGRPVMFSAGRPFNEKKAAVGQDWDTQWKNNPRFRTTLRVLTAVWGLALLADGLLRVYLVYHMSVNQVQLVANIQYAVLVVLLYLFTRNYVKRRRATSPSRLIP